MKRLASIVTLAVLALAAGTSLAQPLPTDPEGDQPPPPPPPDEEPPPPHKLAPAVVEEPAPTPAPVAAEPVELRPTAYSVGIGFGWVLPAELKAPNITSARFRLRSGLTFEPSLTLQHASNNVDPGIMDVTTSTNTVEVGTLVRIPLVSNRKADLELVGGFKVANTTINPDGVDNADSQTAVSVGYGLAVTYWFTPHFQLSMTAVNPLAVYTKHEEDMPMGMSTVTTDTAIGAVWDPQVIGMIHLYL